MIFFGTFICHIHPRSSDYSQKYHSFFFLFLFENECFTLSSSSSSSIYNITIAINTLTHQPTMNNLFEALNGPKFRFLLFISHYLCRPTTSLLLSLYIHQKKYPRFWFYTFKIQTHDSWSLTTGSVSWWSYVW